MVQTDEFIVTGAGPVGLAVSILLKKQGYNVRLYDKRKDPRLHQEHGRSINLALSHRGFTTLALIGLDEKIKSELAVPMPGRMVHDEEGNQSFQPYTADGKSIFSVSRGKLTNLLLDEAEKTGLKIQFEAKCTGFDFENNILHFSDFKTDTTNKTVIACDGAFSPLRNSMKRLPQFSHEEEKLDYGYQEFTVQAGNDGWMLDKNALHIWPRKDFMLIALPNTDKTFTCTLFLKSEGENSFQNLKDTISAKEFFNKYFKDVFPKMLQFESELLQNPVSNLYMETCFPWSIGKQLILLGDAAHAIVPFYGQGLNAGLEDVRLLLTEIQQERNLETAFKKFETARKKDTDAIAALALQNFTEMRDLVADEKFLLKKKLENKIKIHYPSDWKTQYEMVTFSEVPYSYALQKGTENNRKIELLIQNESLTGNLLNDRLTEQDRKILTSIVM